MGWMTWTVPTTVFFIAIGVMLLAMAVWEVASPTRERKGWILPMPTTRGDRLFVGLLASAYINLAWIGLTELALWWALAISVVVVLALLRWG